MTPKTKTTLSHRRLAPVKYMKRRRTGVAQSVEDMERILRNAEIERANKARIESRAFFTS